MAIESDKEIRAEELQIDGQESECLLVIDLHLFVLTREEAKVIIDELGNAYNAGEWSVLQGRTSF